jgi:hypothetical protein
MCWTLLPQPTMRGQQRQQRLCASKNKQGQQTGAKQPATVESTPMSSWSQSDAWVINDEHRQAHKMAPKSALRQINLQ